MVIKEQILTNPKAQRVRRVADLASRKTRNTTNLMLVEGPQAVREAVMYASEHIRDLYVTERMREHAGEPIRQIVQMADERGCFIHMASDEVLQAMSTDCQGIVAVCSRESVQQHHTVQSSWRKIAACWQLRDPGNAGTIIRSVDASGCDALVLLDDCVDWSNPKVVRSSVGSLFHIPIARMSVQDFVDLCAQLHVPLLAADVYGTEQRPAQDLPDYLRAHRSCSQAYAVVFGNEARGLPADVLNRMDAALRIPLYGKAESLNLASSVAIMLMTFAMLNSSADS